MNASNPIEPPVPTGDTRALDARTLDPSRSFEPSMEEILASIRRIIADDQSIPGHGGAPESIEPRAEATERLALAGRDEPDASAIEAPHGPTMPLRTHLMRGETIELDFRSVGMRASQATPPVSQAEAHSETRAEPRVERRAAMSLVAESGPEAPAEDDRGFEGAWEPADGFAEDARAQPVEIDQPDGDHPGHREPDTPLHAALHHEPLHQDPPHRDRHSREPARSGDSRDEPPHGYDEPLGAHLDGADPTRESEDDERGVALAPEGLFSAATDASVAAAFKTLAASRLADNSDELLDIAREMIRPLLKAWIDDNVPSMVERMIRAEIERVARGR